MSMNEITFTQIFKDWRTGNVMKTYNMTVHDETLGEIIEDFEMFLKGCGFSFPEGGRLDICFEDEPSNIDDQDWRTPTGLCPEYGDHGGGSLPEEYDQWPQAHYGHDINLKETK